ncbi:MAG: S8 family serine peptidase [Roseiarcus sp.]|jgi:subtilisin family serine protease
MAAKVLRIWLGRCAPVAAAFVLALTGAAAEGVSGALLPPAAPVEAAAPAKPAPGQPARKQPQRESPAAARRGPPPIARAFPAPAGESRFRRDEILVAFVAGAGGPAIDAVLRRHRLDPIESATIALLGITLRRLGIADAREVAVVLREIGAEPLVAFAQPDYVYALEDDAGAASPRDDGPPQYALAKLRVDRAPAIGADEKVLVAVIDTAIDESHPDLAGAIAARFDAIGGAASARAHGTAIVGAIAARGGIGGVAPRCGILAARAFESAGAGPQGTTYAILEAIDWAARAHARIINMSFAGPPDPALHRILAAVFDKGVMLIAAAGNGGRKSPPLFPGADEKVLAVTATDADDRLFENANVGRYVAVAAPGVDVLLPAPEGAYELATGTSVSAALVSGVAALVLERRPAMQPAALRNVLTTTATRLGGGGHEAEFGAGLVDAQGALAAAAGAASR